MLKSKSLHQGAPAQGKGLWGEFVNKILLPAILGASLSLAFPILKRARPYLRPSRRVSGRTELGQAASSVFRFASVFLIRRSTGARVKIESIAWQRIREHAKSCSYRGHLRDRELFAKAAPYWERIPRVSPGEPGGLSGAATIIGLFLTLTTPCAS